MGIVIDHDARRHKIIAKSIQLFAEQGYDGVTYQKIADSCCIARTTLYKYFKNKRQIFNYAIWEVTNLLVDEFRRMTNPRDTVSDRIERLLLGVVDFLFERRVLLTVILDYLLAAQRSGHNIGRTIAGHTMGLRRILHRLLVEGMRKGELKPLDARVMTELLYSQMEAAVLRLTVSQNADRQELTQQVKAFIDLLKRDA